MKLALSQIVPRRPDMVIGGINVLSLLIQGNVSGGLLAAIIPVVTFLVARRQVGFEPL